MMKDTYGIEITPFQGLAWYCIYIHRATPCVDI